MIDTINWFKIKGDKRIRGYGNNNPVYDFYMVNNIWFLNCYDFEVSYLPINNIRLTIKQKNYIENIEKTLLEFENDKEGFNYFNRVEKLNKILNE